jgi:nucleotide-binding universal stress UspA family protein
MTEEKYLVPIDFSKSSVNALRYAAQLTSAGKNISLLVLHVITEPAGQVPFYLRKQFYRELEQVARKKLAALLKRKSLAQAESTIVIVRAADAAGAIARQAQKSRVSMIIMGSRGRTGLKKLLMGSVAEKTVGSVACPVLIIK